MTTQLLAPEAEALSPPHAVVAAPPGADRKPLIAMLVIALAALASAVMLWSRRGYIPMWDGRIYADCVIDASRNLGKPGGLRCAEHISHAYVALLALAQWLAPSSPVPMLAMNGALLALAAFALFRIATSVLPSGHAVGCALVVGAFLVHPIVLASAVQPGLDFGLLVFTLCALAALLEERRELVILSGLMLVFSKEPGVLLYGMIVGLYLWRHALQRWLPGGAYWLGVAGSCLALLLNMAHGGLLSAVLFAGILAALLIVRPTRQPMDPRAAMRDAARQWTLLLPLIAVFGYMGMGMLHRSQPAAAAAPVVWANTGSSTLVATVFRAGVLDVSTLSVLALMLVIGFLWIPTGIMLLDLCVATVRHGRRAAARVMAGVDADALGIATAALLGSIWLLSRYQTYSNARYYLPVYPLALLVSYASLVRLGVSQRMRAAAFATLGLLLAISVTRTVDPISRALWGTFAVGERSMLVSTSLTGECCGAGRDQLVYNLEFTQFDALTSEALSVIRPRPGTVIVVPPLGDWHTTGQVDVRTGRRTLARTGVLTAPTIPAPVAHAYASELPEAWYLELPYLDNTEALRRLAERFDVSAPARVEHDGYAMDVRRLRRKPVAAR